MDLTIEQNCPSCGASIVLQEDERLIRCGFCDVQNYKVGSNAGRFLLPVNGDIEEHQLIYVPYMRFKGSIFYVHDQEVKHKIVDTTRIAVDDKVLPTTLGLRPQAMKVRPVVSNNRGDFVQQSIPTKTVFVHAARVIDLFNDREKKQTYHRAFIGETLSRLYQPYYLKNDRLYDGVDNREIGPRSLVDKYLPKTSKSKLSWEPQFISTTCPECGGLLSGEKDCIVLQCTNCPLLWQEKKQKFVKVGWKLVRSAHSTARYLPFWKIEVSTSGHRLKSFGDYIRFTNQPVIVSPEYDKRDLCFWIPAFKINPKAFLQIASQLTVAQHRIPVGKTVRVSKNYPATLNQSEGLQAIKSVLAQTTLSKKMRMFLLPKIQFKEVRSVLTYLPFLAQTHDLVQEHTHASIQTAALRYGRKL